MPQRLRFVDLRLSDIPESIGLCAADAPRLAAYANESEERLLTCREVGDEGWHGSFAEMAFNVDPANPFITAPRQVARLEHIDVCGHPVAIDNVFYEYLLFGNGRMPKQLCAQRQCDWLHVYSRNSVPTFIDLTKPPQILRVRVHDPVDADGKHRIFLQGTDNTGATIVTQDVFNLSQGIFVTLNSPFADAPVQFNSITGVQKDATSGSVSVFQVDPTTGAEILLLTMEPSEMTAWYRRYYLHRLPPTCCPGTTPGTVQVTAIAKLAHIPVRVDTDYLVLQSLPAFKQECQAIRYERMDAPAAKSMALQHHVNAIRYLQGQLVEIYGKTRPAVNFNPFGSARLEKERIGILR